MIVQTASEDGSHFIIYQHEHARASGQLAAAFGNESFVPLSPRELIEYMVAHHDEGWLAVDANQTIDPRTHLPYHLTQTPGAQLIATGAASPNHNETEHPLCGILSSMHTYGLYHGRYGLSDKIYIDTLGSDVRPQIEAMLSGELKRQARLKSSLRADPITAPWADDSFLFHYYKLLQFFDTLSLYVHMTPYSALTSTTFKNVPQSMDQDVIIEAEPLGGNRVGLSPFPFAADVVMTTRGRCLQPIEDRTVDLQLILRGAEVVTQTVAFTKGEL